MTKKKISKDTRSFKKNRTTFGFYCWVIEFLFIWGRKSKDTRHTIFSSFFLDVIRTIIGTKYKWRTFILAHHIKCLFQQDISARKLANRLPNKVWSMYQLWNTSKWNFSFLCFGQQTTEMFRIGCFQIYSYKTGFSIISRRKFARSTK